MIFCFLILTLFHEFGHALHDIFQRDPLREPGELSKLCLDFIELPSQLNELWCFEISMLKKLSAEKIPETILASFVEYQKKNQALYYLKELSFGLFDKVAHQKHDCYELSFLLSTTQNIIPFPTKLLDTTPCTFSHIIGGGYEAGYISYLYSKVYAHQVFDIFQHDSSSPMRFREIVLAESNPRNLRKALEKQFLKSCLDLRLFSRVINPEYHEALEPLVFSKRQRNDTAAESKLKAKL